MIKSHKFDDLSTKECITPGCHCLIKTRLVKPSAPQRCFKCHQAYQSHTNNPCVTAREVKTGKEIGRGKGIYVIN